MISTIDAKQRAEEQLAGFPQTVVDHYLAYAESNDPGLLDAVMLGVLEFYLAKPPAQPLTQMPGSTRLMEDLGVDSLAMVDTLFMAESLFGTTLTDDELARVNTLDDLRGHFRRHLATSAAHAA